MVFLGKPSRACVHCRRRKLRCDLRKAGCSQCTRAGLICSGYRDPNQLRIQDETQNTMRRSMVGKSRAIVPSIQVPLEETARAAFFLHYVSGFSTTYDVLDRMGKQSPWDEHLTASVDAVSVAFFSSQQYSMQASKSARENYSRALPLVKKAVGSPEFLASDSTLLAVLFLDLFEKMMNNNPRSSDSWMSHVRGAMALFRLRDPEQLKTYIGLRLSLRLFLNMLISCVAADAPVPSALIKLRMELEPYMSENNPKWLLSGLVVKYATLRGNVKTGRLTVSETIRQAKKLDSEFSSLSKSLPPAWSYRRVALKEESPRVLEYHYNVYPDSFTTQTCNVICTMRILLNDIIRDAYIHSTPGTHDPAFQSLQLLFASRIIDAMAKEICATGPQLTGVEARSNPSESTPIRKIHCYTLIFPFYVAGMYSSLESGIRKWTVEQMRYMATDYNIKNAAVVADILERRDGTSPWSVYAVLGSYAFAA